MRPGPDLSVVLVTASDSEVLRLSLAHLRRQTASGRVEVLLVAPSKAAFPPEAMDPRGFHSIRVVDGPELASEGARKAAGVLAAQAPLVAFVEDHSFPRPDWADVVLRTHGARDCALVAPVMENANPARATSWACFLVFYGPCMERETTADPVHLPSNQCCYRKDVLLEYGVRLAGLLEAETVLLEADWRHFGRAIVEEAKDWQADLIVMGTHGHTALVQLVFGSVAEGVIRRAPVPVLLVRGYHDTSG